MPLCSRCVCFANSCVDISQQYSKYLELLLLAPKANHAASASPRYSVRALITSPTQHLLTIIVENYVHGSCAILSFSAQLN